MPVSFRLQWRCQNRSGPGRRAATGTGAAAKRRQSGCRLVACDDDPGGTARASVALDMSKRPIGVGHHGYLLDLAAAHERDGNRSLCGELCAAELDEVAVLDDRDEEIPGHAGPLTRRQPFRVLGGFVRMGGARLERATSCL